MRTWWHGSTAARETDCSPRCAPALLVRKTGRLRGLRATTHHKSLGELVHYGTEAVRERVVETCPTITAAGVIGEIYLGLHLVDRLMGAKLPRGSPHRWSGRRAPYALLPSRPGGGHLPLAPNSA